MLGGAEIGLTYCNLAAATSYPPDALGLED